MEFPSCLALAIPFTSLFTRFGSVGSSASRSPLTSQTTFGKESQRCSRIVQVSGIRVFSLHSIRSGRVEERTRFSPLSFKVCSPAWTLSSQYSRIRISGRLQCSRCQWPPGTGIGWVFFFCKSRWNVTTLSNDPTAISSLTTRKHENIPVLRVATIDF